MANIKVAVRVRPISPRELSLTGSEVVVRTEASTIFLTNLKVSSSKAGDSRERTRRYGFDYCFDSSDPGAENYANQSRIYVTLGQSVLDALFAGYNACFVAYGQSASGKTYTMMGCKDDPGLTPRLCEGLFSRIQEEQRKERNYRVSVSYLEIYNDRVRDLLKPAANASGLKVREHPRLGPYVQGLTHHVVGTLGSLMSYVEEGTRARKTALTLQNSCSSRSHALLTVSLHPESANSASNSYLTPSSTISEQSSRRKDDVPRGGNKLHLVDLAGSESAATCSGVNRLKEGANINKSLVALGNVISALAERGSTGSGPGRRFIPYRDSSLTWLLKDALGGNATTIMLATISPASGSYNETAHTLRFAQRAQSVVNRPVVNENPVARIIRELRDEVARLKSLLLEKENNDPEAKSLCCCKEIQTVDNLNADKDKPANIELSLDRHCMEVKNQNDVTERMKEAKDVPSIRRFNSTESLTTSSNGSSGPIRKFGSFEFLSSKNPFAACNYYNRAKVTELNDEEDEIVDEINEPVFVDIPTLVAVLIKPDDSLQESSTQIEEICSDEVQEDSIDVEFIENGNNQEVFESIEKIDSVDQEERSSINSNHVLGDIDGVDCQQNAEDYTSHASLSSPRNREKGKFRKQDSIDVPTHVGSSNLHTSKRFGSVEGLPKKKEPFVVLERSHTNLEKRQIASDRTKKLNNIREIEDQKAHGRPASVWRDIGSSGSKDHLQRKGSNDSDKSLKESNGQNGSKSKNGAVRKPSLENLKRKTSKDSSSSSSKEEQIVISSLTRDKLLRRKGSLDQEPPVARTHTPIQRVKRAEIVAAVTERLYASRKHVEESMAASTPGSGTRSPPEAAEVKLGSPFTTRTKLQEISRKMLAKRRRVCVDTQTDNDRTVRVKDTASLTEEPEVICQDAAVLTDHHENCDLPIDSGRLPILRVKEIATLTDRPRTTMVRCKDAECLANDLDDYDYEIHSPRNDSGILSDDTQNYAESNLSSTEVSDACTETDRKVVCTDSSTNTMYLSPGRSPTSQASRQDPTRQQQKPSPCDRQCCNMSPDVPQIATPATPEKNVISISLPDMISITIESRNGIESRIAMTDCTDTAEETIKPKLRDIEAQTDEKSVSKEENESVDSHFCFKDLSRSAAGTTDGKIFRIENIFQDPKIVSKACTKVDTVSDAGEDSGPRKSVTFTNSLGTSFVPDTRERATEMEREKIHAEDKTIDFQKRSSFAQAFVSKRCGYGGSLPEAPQSAFYSNSSTICTCPARAIDSAEFKKEFQIVTTSWQQPCNEVSRNGLTSPCHNGVVCMATNNCVPLVMKHRQIENPHEIRELSVDVSTCHRCTNVTEPCALKSSPVAQLDTKNDYECNFSDDSLDYDEEDASNECKPSKLNEANRRENHDNLCPPDVVAHTKKDASTSSGYMNVGNTESSANSDFEDTRVELPRKKAADMSTETKVHDYKSLILGDPLIMFSGSSEKEEDECKTPSSQSSGSSKKKVSFSNVTEERSQRKLDRQASSELKQASHVELKSIIKKKKKKSNALETLERSQSSTDSTSTDDSVHSKMSLTDDSQDSCAFDKNAFKLDKRLESSNSQDSDEFCIPQDVDRKNVQFSNQEFDDNYSETDSEGNIISDEEYPVALRRNVVQEYLDQATTFMRNMNSINEYMNATKMFDRYLGRCKRRGSHHRREYRSQKHDYVEYQGRRISLKDDSTEYINDDDDDDIVVPIESYERCLASISRLENCIDRVNKHTELLREKYNINVESAGAKLDLARTSSDSTTRCSRNDTDKADPAIEVPSESMSRSSRGSKNIWSADQADYTKDFGTTEGSILKQISDLDLDGKNGNVKHGLDDDLEKRIFHQLMSVVESSRCTKRLRDRYPSETLDLRSVSPPTYSRSRTRYRSDKRDFFRSDTDGCIDTNHPISSTESDLNNSRNENDSLHTALFSTEPTIYESRMSIPKRSRSLDIVESSEDDDLSISDELAESARLRNVCTRSYESDGFSRRIKNFVPSKRILSSSIGTLRVENSSSGDDIGANVKPIDGVSHFRDKLKYPGSPRVKFLELLNERRRIVESTRGMSAS